MTTDGVSSAAHQPTPDAGLGFSGTQTAKIVGITYRQLDYWARTDLIRPSLAEASGSGSRRLYSYRDLLELRVVKTLLDAGIKLEQVRNVFDNLRASVGDDLAAANIVISGTTSVVLQDNDELIELMRTGQGVLNILPMAGVVAEVDNGISENAPDVAAAAQLRLELDEPHAVGL